MSSALSRKEKILVSPSRTVPAGRNVNHILCIAGDLISEEKAYFRKEIYATGHAVLGPENVVQALAADGTVTLGMHTSVLRWADAGQAADIRAGCNLGVGLSCGGEIRIARGCSFQRLYGFPIITGSADSGSEREHHDLDEYRQGKAEFGSRRLRQFPGAQK